MKFYFFLLGLFTLLGCAKGVDNTIITEEDYHCDGSFYTADGEFSTDEKEQIQIAVTRLNDWLGFEAAKVGNVGKCLMGSEAIQDKSGIPSSYVIGYWDGYQIALDVKKIHRKYDWSDKFNDVFQVAVIHELLHSFGMEHHEGPGIMNAVVGFEFTTEDRMQCLKDKVCSLPVP